MRLLFSVLVLCVVLLLWAAFSVARHIHRHSQDLRRTQAEMSNGVDSPLDASPIAERLQK